MVLFSGYLCRIESGSYSLDCSTHDIKLKCQAVRKIVYGELWSLWFIIYE